MANKHLGKRFLEEVWNEGKRETIAELVAADCVVHDAAGDAVGPEGFYPFYDRMRTAISNVKLVVEDLMEDGDRICVRWSCSATHTGDSLGIPATNKPYVVTGITIMRVRDGQFVEAWQNWDMYAMMQQIGAIERPAPTYIGRARAVISS